MLTRSALPKAPGNLETNPRFFLTILPRMPRAFVSATLPGLHASNMIQKTHPKRRRRQLFFHQMLHCPKFPTVQLAALNPKMPSCLGIFAAACARFKHQTHPSTQDVTLPRTSLTSKHQSLCEIQTHKNHDVQRIQPPTNQAGRLQHNE